MLQSSESCCAFFIVGDSDGVGGDSEDGEEDEGGEEGPEDADEALTEAAEGEEMAEKEEAGGDEFVDKELESQFCLETNFMDEGGQEDTESTTEHEDRKGKNRVKTIQFK